VTFVRIGIALVALALAGGCVASPDEVEAATEANRTSRDEGDFPRDVDELIAELMRANAGGAQPYVEYVDVLRRDPRRAATMLDEARRGLGPSAARSTVVYTIGELGHEGSIAALEDELAACRAEPSSGSPGPSEVTSRCDADDVPPDPAACATVVDDFDTDRVTTDRMLALDAFDRIVARAPTRAHAARFFETLDPLLERDCAPALRAMAAVLYVQRSADRERARRDLARRVTDRPELVSLEPIRARDLPRRVEATGAGR